MRTLLLAALTAAYLAGPAGADPASEALFAEGIFDALPEGQRIAYSVDRRGDAVPDFVPVTDGRITLEVGAATDGTPRLSMTIEAGDQRREFAEFPASGGNPVLMVFLESTVRNMAAMSGGSPFYIRNRIKDALRQGGDLAEAEQSFLGGTVAAQELTPAPVLDRSQPRQDGAVCGSELALRAVGCGAGAFPCACRGHAGPGIGLSRNGRLRRGGGRRTRLVRLALPCLLAATHAGAQSQPTNDYPTEARAAYVFGCMAVNDQTPKALRRCSCAIDEIATILDFDAYVSAETVLTMRQTSGERSTLFRDTAPANSFVADLRRAEAEAEIICF